MTTDEQIKALRRALVRLLWHSVADAAECTCEDDDKCPECDAFNALGLGAWPGAEKAGDMLVEVDQ